MSSRSMLSQSSHELRRSSMSSQDRRDSAGSSIASGGSDPSLFASTSMRAPDGAPDGSDPATISRLGLDTAKTGAHNQQQQSSGALPGLVALESRDSAEASAWC